MTRILHMLAETLATFRAACMAGAATEAHRIPAPAALRQLGIDPRRFREIRL